jgi:hypothetical protein
VAVKERCQVKISNRFVTLKNLDDDDDDDDDDSGGDDNSDDVYVCRAWESSRENMKSSATEFQLL